MTADGDDDDNDQNAVPEGDLAQPGKTPLYSPDQVEATRMREQGLGMGAEELNAQRDPTRAKSADETADDQPPAPREDTDKRH